MLKEKAGQYYFVQDKSCAEAILLAANEAYHLGMTEEATKLFAGFRTGMGMGRHLWCAFRCHRCLEQQIRHERGFKDNLRGFCCRI